MSLNQCEKRSFCPTAAIIISIIVGVVTSILQGTEVISLAPVFLYGALVTALSYLGVLLIAAAINERKSTCSVSGLAALIGTLGTIAFSGLLLGVSLGAGIIGSILAGVLLFFVTLMLSSVACLVKCLFED